MSNDQIRIVAIEDDEGDALVLHRFVESMERCQAELTMCSTGEEALAELARRPADVLLLDGRLGAGSGLVVLEAIREAGHDGPVIFLTGRGDEALAADAQRAGAADYLAKGALSRNSLERAIGNAREKHRLRQMIEGHRRHLERTNVVLETKIQEIERFHDVLSRELEAPLTALHELLAILSGGMAGPLTDEQKELLAIALERCDQLELCVDEMVDVTCVETGKLTLKRAPEDVEELVRGLVRSMEPIAREVGVSLGAQLAGGLPRVHVDARRVEQVLRNLVGNALEHTDEGGSVGISIALDRDPERVRVSVVDTGCGIPEESRARVFERGGRAHTGDGAREALGLGLHICKVLVALHHGEIGVESEPGRGSTFWFTLPVHAEHAVLEGAGAHEDGSRGGAPDSAAGRAPRRRGC